MELPIETRLDADPLQGVATRAHDLASMGFDGAFTFEGPHDVFTPLVLAAGSGVDLDLTTNVAIAFPRSPVHLAHQAYDLQTLSRGRFRLGLGSQIKPHIERRYGSKWSHPVERMRETVLATKAVLETWQTGAPLDFRGEFTTHTFMPPTFNPGPNPFGVPKILVGALGPKMVEMTTAVADGLLVHPFNSDRFVRDVLLVGVEEGLAAAGRQRTDFEVMNQHIVSCGRNDEEQAVADAAARWLIAFYGSTPAYRRVLECEGYGDLQPEMRRLTKEDRWEELPGLVDDILLERITVRGTPDEIAAEVTARSSGVVDRIGLTFPSEVDAGCAGEVLAAIRRV